MPIRNDLSDASSPFEANDMLVLHAIGSAHLRISRRDAELWAIRDCKFIVYDDTPSSDTEDDEYDSDDADDDVRMGIRLSLQGDQSDDLHYPRGPKATHTDPSQAPSYCSDGTTGRSYLGLCSAKFQSQADNDSGGNKCDLEDAKSDEINSDGESGGMTRDKGKSVSQRDHLPVYGEKATSADNASTIFFGDLGPNYGPSLSNGPAQSPASNPESRQCRICSTIPEFPLSRRKRRFRLTRLRDEHPELFSGDIPNSLDICPHYLAVSYCWPPRRTDDDGKNVEIPRSYKVRDIDGTVRKNRALDDVLDRAVEAANMFGMRMIWIDQECLPQPPEDSEQPYKKDKELGIQAMDILYNRAFVTAGLHDVQFSCQGQLDTILKLVSDANARNPTQKFGSSHELQRALEFLDAVSRDGWYTRAWVSQEAISAGDNLCLIFRRAPNVSCPSKVRQPNNRRGLPSHTLEELTRSRSSEIVCIMVHEFRYIVETVKHHLRQMAFINVNGMSYRDMPGRTRAEETVNRAELLHPSFWKPKHHNFRFGVIGFNKYGIRPTVNAAGALSILRNRGCWKTEDLIPIMANMCGYEMRLDASIIAEKCDSLRPVLLRLALLNGDLSLLVSEVYTSFATKSDEGRFEDKLLQDFRPSWIHPFDVGLPSLGHGTTIYGFNLARSHSYINSNGSVTVPAYKWEVDDKPMDMTPVKFQWQEEWAAMSCIVSATERQEGEDLAAYRVRMNAINARLNKGEVRSQIKRELLDFGSVRNDSSVWHGIERYAGTAHFELILLADRVESIPSYQKLMAEIFFGILRFLVGQSDTDPRAQGAADSIWQSVRTDVVREEDPELPDTVSEELFQHPTIRHTPFQALKLDRDHRGGYNQVWLIDRIMSRGYLWVGRYIPEPRPRPGPDRFLLEDHGQPAQDGTLIEKTSSEEDFWESFKGIHGPLRPQAESIMGQQMERLIHAEVAASSTFAAYLNGDNDPRRQANMPGLIIDTSVRVKRGLAGETEEKRARKLVSVVDVAGPCTIAIPWDSAWEMIPHPYLRSMSVCWVVEPGKNAWAAFCEAISPPTAGSSSISDRANRADAGDCIRVLEKVRGFWPVMTVSPWKHYVLE